MSRVCEEGKLNEEYLFQPGICQINSAVLQISQMQQFIGYSKQYFWLTLTFYITLMHFSHVEFCRANTYLDH